MRRDTPQLSPNLTSSSPGDDPERQRLARRLITLFELDEALAHQIVEELREAWSQQPDQFIEQRHQALQRQGYRGDEIYTLLQLELKQRRFAAPPLSLRQIRRRIYGG